LLELVFRQGETTVPIQSFLSQRARGVKFVAALREELKAAGMIDESRARARLKLLVAGGIGLAAGVALLAMGIASGKPAPFSYLAAGGMVVGGAVAAAGGLGLILGRIQSIWSDAGAVAAAQWTSFAHYLAQAGLGRAALPDPADCELLLPYAAAFGWAAHLLMQQQKRGGFVLPPWFQAFQTSDGSDFIAFSTLMVCDSQGSGGGGGGFGGGGGASGGGASGAG
jgi:uncharacterized membrane protein YgcG